MEENLLPIVEGSRVGLFGGSFNPAHEWHYQVSNRALTKFKLDKVIWLVSPNNPLKEIHNLMGYDERFKSAQKLARSLDFFVSDFEKKIQSEYSIDTVKKIMELHPKIKFIWIMGSDCAAEIEKWREWENFLKTLPVAIYPRPSFTADSGKLRIIKEFCKNIDDHENLDIIQEKPPCITFIPGPMSNISSTTIREGKID